MASNYFTINPTSGTGNGVITVTPTGTNMTITDKLATVTIGDKTVAITHYGIPSIARVGGPEPVIAPATGDVYQYKVQTHYQVQFCNKPDWIDIDDGQGNYISSAQTIAANVANGHTYNFSVKPNSGNTQREAPVNFGLWHYINGTLQQVYDEVEISQPQGAEDYITITPTSALDWDDTNGKSITINANVSYSVSHSNTTDFTLNGGNGYVTIKANDTNTGTTLKTDTISVVSTKASFPYTATCVVTQYRQPRIVINGSASNLPWSGSSKPVTVVSDYYWWLSPTVSPDTNAYYEYITMQGKTADMNMPPVSSTTYNLTWNQNTGVTARTGYIYVGYLKLDNSTTGRSSTSVYFSQDYQASSTFVVTPARIPASSSDYVSSGGGTYQLSVITERPWSVYSTHSYCSISPTSGTGNATVTVVVPASTKDGYSYSQVDGLAFGTTDAEIGAYQTVYVYQYDRYTETPYVVVDPDDFDLSSATTSCTYTVSANTSWRAYVVDGDGYPVDWIDMPTTAGTSGYTTGLHFDVAVNLTDSARTAIIQFQTGAGISIVTEVNISQAAGAPVENFFVVTSTPSTGISFNSGSTGSIGKYLTVSASTDWNVTSKPGWISLGTSPFGGTNVISGTSGSTTVYPRPSENSGSSRSGYVYMTSVAGLSGRSAVITQESGYTPTPPTPTEPFLTITIPANQILSVGSGGTTTGQVSISASTNWVVDTKPSWTRYRTSFSNTDSTVTSGTAGAVTLWTTVDANTGDTRSGVTVFELSASQLTARLTTEQEAAYEEQYDDLYVEPEDSSSVLMNIPATGGVYSFYFENDGADAVDWEINFNDEEWGGFYDGPNPEQSDAVNMIEAGTIGYIWLYVDGTASSRSNTITFYPSEGAGTLTQKTFYIHQNS